MASDRRSFFGGRAILQVFRKSKINDRNRIVKIDGSFLSGVYRFFSKKIERKTIVDPQRSAFVFRGT
jgi:hypothetical protein